MIDNEDAAKRFLLATSPDNKIIKDNIFKDIILKTTEEDPLTAPHIHQKLFNDYKISVDKTFFQDYMDDLKEKGFLVTTVDDYGRLQYQASAEKNRILKENENDLNEVMNRFCMEIGKQIPLSLDYEYNSNKKLIFLDFIKQYSAEIDKNYYAAIVNNIIPPTINNINLICRIDNLSDDLNDKLNIIYRDILNFFEDDFINSLTAICIFWSTFIRITSLDDADKNFMLEEIKATRIFADTNTLIAYGCRYDSHHEDTYDYYNSLMNSLNIKIYYTSNTKEELIKKMDSAHQIIRSMQHYPERSRYWAKTLNDGIVQTYIFGDFISWEYFKEEFWENIDSHFILCDKEEIDKLGISNIEIKNELERIGGILRDKNINWPKGGKKESHDLSLLALVNCIREQESKNDWFKYTSWIATTDRSIANLDKSIFNGPDVPDAPNISLLVRYIPLYFHPFYFLKSLSAVNDAYNLLCFSKYEIARNNAYRKKLIENLENFDLIKDKKDFEKKYKDNLNKWDEKFIKFADRILNKECGFNGDINGNE